MPSLRKKYTPEEKAKIALEALSGRYTLSQLTSKYSVHSTQINAWKQRLKSGVSNVFRDRRRRDDEDKAALIDELYKKIGQLNIELEWMKKKSERFD